MPADATSASARPRRERPLVAAGREKRADAVVLKFSGRDPQQRSTVFFRGVLVIPHLLWLFVVSFGAQLAVTIGWFVALFTGELPAGIAEFLRQVLQYQTRVTAYGPLLLTDHFPSFSLTDSTHSIVVETSPGPLNRWAVLFRLVLMVPSTIVSALLSAGAQLVGVVGWVITLVRGELPAPLFAANEAVLRYQAHTTAFALMLTAEQPRGLFRSDASPRARRGGVDIPESDVPVVPDWPPLMRVALSRAARRLLVLFLALGAFGGVAWTGATLALVATSANFTTRGDVLRGAHDDLTVALRRFNADVKACPAGDGQLACLHVADTRFAAAFDAFGVQVGKIRTTSTIDTSVALSDARACAAALRARASTADAASFDAALPPVRDSLRAFDADYAALLKELPK
jgi:hypothetical protein